MSLTPVLTEVALLGTLKTRYATKLFDPQRKIPAPTWAALEETLVLSQSAFGAQPWKFLVVDSQKIRTRLRPHTWDQPAVTDASKFVAFLARKATCSVDIAHYLARIAEVRGITIQSLKGFNDVILETLSERALDGKLTDWAARQLYIALGQFTTAAALLGVDTCPIEGLDPKKYNEVLQLGDSPFTAVLTVAAGYRSEMDKYAALAKVRFPLAEIVQHI
jgi:nitroreductase